MGETYAEWSGQAAACIAADSGLPPKVQRGLHMASSWGPVFSRRRGVHSVEFGLVNGTAATTWSGGANAMRIISKLILKERGDIQVTEAAKWLQDNLMEDLEQLWVPKRRKQWVPGPRPRSAKSGDMEFPDLAAMEDGHTVWEYLPPGNCVFG